ncbi:1-acyl-sn-glycerol-3-phosphate acyltransferase [Deinococcus aetherius]|uniref:1-acyl-sn-glycerol-3-phosphate acyltransferase n=1 Tax=Deinococcus aetherius TaxID=200252 RepID=A0ABM8AHF1_9DEIO|nr:1-acyl-sn-glycerol-3-phosphate acyltransferase [Deinococcus aetherius]BDP43185.1 1-acyl-sn-glycerol-3-phosphate acyltransferase [Deinococcus aetherius]
MSDARPSPAPPAETLRAPRVNPLVYRLVVIVTTLPIFLRGQGIEVHGRENVPPPGTPLIVAGNHRTGFDPFLIARSLPPGRYLQFMAKKELFVPVIGHIIRAGGSFPVDRSANDLGAVRTSLRILQGGGTLGIFPEGTRGGGELQGGVALMALKGKAPVLPVGLSRVGRRWVVRFGEPIAPTGGIKALTALIGERITALAEPVGEVVRSR